MDKVSFLDMIRVVAHIDTLVEHILSRCERKEFPEFLAEVIRQSVKSGEFERLLVENVERQCSPEDIVFLYERMTSEDGKREAKIVKVLGPSMEETINNWRSNLQRVVAANSMAGLIKTLRELGMPEELAEKLENSGKAVIMSVGPNENIQDKIDEMVKNGELDELIDPCDNPNCDIHGKKNKDPDGSSKKPTRRIDSSAFGM